MVVEKRMMGPKPEKTTFCSKRSALGGSGAEGEGGAEGGGAVGLEYLSSSGCSSLGNAEKSGVHWPSLPPATSVCESHFKDLQGNFPGGPAVKNAGDMS